ncbi:hypothetical protein [Pedobacter rhizosphaerae]|uniref:Uncharacterized protein n=1 Tax=Pedobacter rhizosphaerae TaxID=390241 RepID=A0A1H9KPJ7_9SPHI|nr:hypothetical protein [Pedobacter rhizosphaerae]SER00855.1 hypothetical protein SAMN04488023_10386 [Pedobacter rhizosphaerae]
MERRPRYPIHLASKNVKWYDGKWYNGKWKGDRATQSLLHPKNGKWYNGKWKGDRTIQSVLHQKM